MQKDLLLILEAVRQAQRTLAECLGSGGERVPDAAIRELAAILAAPDVAQAVQRLDPLVDSPSVQSEPNPEDKLQRALPGS